MNNVILKGRITNDLEIKTTRNGTETLQFTVAVDRYAGKNQEKITDFIPCRAWRQNAAFISTYFSKGKEILLTGNFYIDKYEKDGEKRSWSYINVQSCEFCGSRAGSNSEQSAFFTPAEETKENEDGELPF